MGEPERVIKAPSPRRLPAPPPGVKRRKPRDYVEWKTLRGWGKLPPWDELPAGYLLREAREKAGLTQAELAERLECTQQAVARAERWASNPTVAFVRRWARAVGAELTLDLNV